MNFWIFKPDFFKHLEEGFQNFLREKGSEMKSEYYFNIAADQLVKSKKPQVKTTKTPPRGSALPNKRTSPTYRLPFKACTSKASTPTAFGNKRQRSWHAANPNSGKEVVQVSALQKTPPERSGMPSSLRLFPIKSICEVNVKIRAPLRKGSSARQRPTENTVSEQRSATSKTSLFEPKASSMFLVKRLK